MALEIATGKPVWESPRPVPGFDRMYRREALLEAVRELDYLVLLTPHTPDTHGIVDAQLLAGMKPTSYVVNLARGGVVDEAALIDALDAGRLAGAALDVFAEEPLPAGHRFWDMEQVIVTPHLGGFCDVYVDDALPIVEENIRRFIAGNRDRMINVVRR